MVNILNEIDEQIKELRKVKAQMEEIDLDPFPEEAKAEGFSRTEVSLILRDLRELLD